jgi:putative ubiquitin-RnfH superfamily antitoxin RatB of RatAB toxin-antitoxin module
MAHAEVLQIEVVYAPAPGAIDSVSLQLHAGAVLADALRSSGLLQRHGLQLDGLLCGIWSRQQPLDKALRDRDRVEIYRSLTVDPKEARRLRYSQHRQRVAAAGGPNSRTNDSRKP